MTNIEIKGEDGCVRIHVLEYERVEYGDASDANWLRCNVEIDVPPFMGSFFTSFEVQDFTDFYIDIESLYKALEGEVLFAPVEGALSLKFAMKNRGEITIDGEAIPQSSSRVALRFSLHSDQTFLKELIRSIKLVAERYPLRRAPAS